MNGPLKVRFFPCRATVFSSRDRHSSLSEVNQCFLRTITKYINPKARGSQSTPCLDQYSSYWTSSITSSLLWALLNHSWWSLLSVNIYGNISTECSKSLNRRIDCEPSSWYRPTTIMIMMFILMSHDQPLWIALSHLMSTPDSEISK